jgi:TRAP transporter TAXI family solute receptor
VREEAPVKSITKRTGKWVILFMILLLATFLPAVQAQPIKVDKSKWPSEIGFAVGPMGSHGFIVGSVWAPVVNKALGINISVENTGGAVHNAMLVAMGTDALGMSYNGIALDGWEGHDKWAGNKKLRTYRAWVIGFPMVITFYTLEKTGIQTLADLNGKVVSLNQLGSGSNLWGNLILKALGIKPERIATVSPSDSNSLLQDGGIAAALCQGTPPHPAVVELSSTQKVRVLGLSPEQQAKLVKEYPKMMKPYTIPAGTYKGQEKPILSVTDYEIWLVNTAIPEDLVYMITKATWENKAKLIQGLQMFKMIKPEEIVESPIPVSRGAYLYYKAIGIKIPKDIMPVD